MGCGATGISLVRSKYLTPENGGAPDADFYTHALSTLCRAAHPLSVTVEPLLIPYAVSIEDDHLVGEAWGEPVDRTKHDPAVEVKGATLSELHVERRAEGLWIAQCIVDV